MNKSEYSDEIKNFAITLNFYSAKAYEYVRTKFDKLLPHPSTIRRWYQGVNGKPGFTKESFLAIEKHPDIIWNIVFDEISIKQDICFKNGKFYGYIYTGNSDNNENFENMPFAKTALFFMAVALNSNKKLPLGYFLINGLSGQERANFIQQKDKSILLRLMERTQISRAVNIWEQVFLLIT